MEKTRIFITRKIHESGINLLKQAGYEVIVYQKNKVIPKKELYAAAKNADALLCLLTDKIDKEFLDANTHLKVIANYAVGFDNVDISYATQKKILITNTPGVLTEAVAEHTFALMFTITRKIVEADSYLRKGKYKSFEPLGFLGPELKGKILGIIGTGRIGYSVAVRAVKGLGMKLIYNDVQRNESLERDASGEFATVDELLKKSDIISIHVPLLPETRHLINAKKLKLMKKTAYLINTARGPIVDEKALVSSLQKKQIAGAALDVYEFEPKLSAGLAKLSNVVITPHIASATIEARSAMSNLAAQGIIDVLNGKVPANVVNKEVFRR